METEHVFPQQTAKQIRAIIKEAKRKKWRVQIERANGMFASAFRVNGQGKNDDGSRYVSLCKKDAVVDLRLDEIHAVTCLYGKSAPGVPDLLLALAVR